MKYKSWILLVLLLLKGLTPGAQTTIASLFKDHLVLQRDTSVAIWGHDIPGRPVKVTASWGATGTALTNNEGKWKLFLKTTAAGGPYTVLIQGSKRITLRDVLLGEVWICSGQSNMEMPVSGFGGQPVLGSNEMIVNSSNPRLRLFKVRSNMSNDPVDSCGGEWKAAAPESVAGFSAVAYLYGAQLQKVLNVPVGIICSSVGGTRVEAWTKKETLAATGFDFGAAGKNRATIDKNDPSVLFNAMIYPLIPYGIKGVVWYQGESNRINHYQYKDRFSAMLQSWRKDWARGVFPFYFAQIAPYSYTPDVNTAFLREAQLFTLQQTINTGMAVTLDIGEAGTIHPAHKKEIAQRLAYWALAKTYGMGGIQYSGPEYQSMKVVKNTVQLSFRYAPGGLCTFGKPLSQFTIAGADKKFHPATASIQKGMLIVYSKEVPQPVAVRYAWENYTDASLFNWAGLPASSFRTDNWAQ